jgi:hypothetical protein
MFISPSSFQSFLADMGKQVGGPLPPAIQSTFYPASLADALNKNLVQWLLSPATGPSPDPVKFRTPSNRYATSGLLGQCHGAIVVAQLRIGPDPDQLTPPFVITTDRPLTSLSQVTMDSPFAPPSILGILDEWAPGGVPLPDGDMSLLLLSLVHDTRSRSLDSLATAFTSAASSIWIAPKGSRMGLTAFGSDFFEPPAGDVDNEVWWKNLWIPSDQAGQLGSRFETGQDKPPFLIASDAVTPNGVWVLPAILPLPQYHTLPFGFGMLVTPDLTITKFLAELRVWCHAPDDFAGFLENPLTTAWFRAIAKDPTALALEVMPLSQCNESLFALETVSTDALPLPEGQELYVAPLRANVVHHWSLEHWIASPPLANKTTASRALGYVQTAAAAINAHPDLSLDTLEPACYPCLWNLADPPFTTWITKLEVAALRRILPLPSWIKSAFTSFSVTLDNIKQTQIPEIQTIDQVTGSEATPKRTLADQSVDERDAGNDALRMLFTQSSAKSVRQTTPQALPSQAASLHPGFKALPKKLLHSVHTHKKVIDLDDLASLSEASAASQHLPAVAPADASAFYHVPWQQAATITHQEDSGWGIPVDYCPVQWPLTMHALLPVSRMDSAMTPEQARLRFDLRNFLTGVLPSTFGMLSLLASYRLRHGPQTSVTHLVLTHPASDRFWPHEWLLLPLSLSPTWIRDVVLSDARAVDSLVSHLTTRISAAAVYAASYRRDFGFPAPMFRSRFFHDNLALVAGLRQGLVDDGLDVASSGQTSLPPAFSFWYILGSLSSASDGKVPLRGLSTYAVQQLLANSLCLLDQMFFDPGAYPDLPPGHGSPFLISSPLAGAIIHAIRIFQNPPFIQAWTEMYEDKISHADGTRAYVTALLHHLGYLLKQLRSSMPFLSAEQDLQPANVRGGPARIYDSICVINTKCGAAQSPLQTVFSQWNDDLHRMFSVSSLAARPSGCLAFNLPTASFLLAPEPVLKDTESVANRAAKRRADAEEKNDRRKKLAASRSEQLQGSTSEGKSASVPLFVWASTMVPRPTSTAAMGVWFKEWKEAEKHSNPDGPKIRKDLICVTFLTKGCVCDGKNGRSRPCRLSHIDYLACAPGTYTKADFQLVLDWLALSSVRPIFQLSPEAKQFLEKFA